MNLFDAYIGSIAVDKRRDGGVRHVTCPACGFHHLVAKRRDALRCKRCAHVGKVGESHEHFREHHHVPSDDGDVFPASSVRTDT